MTVRWGRRSYPGARRVVFQALPYSGGHWAERPTWTIRDRAQRETERTQRARGGARVEYDDCVTPCRKVLRERDRVRVQGPRLPPHERPGIARRRAEDEKLKKALVVYTDGEGWGC